MRKLFEIGGILAAIVLIAFGVGAIVLGIPILREREMQA
jgi:hypothetical protein